MFELLESIKYLYPLKHCEQEQLTCGPFNTFTNLHIFQCLFCDNSTIAFLMYSRKTITISISSFYRTFTLKNMNFDKKKHSLKIIR